MSVHHQFANQELARLDYAEAIRNSSRRHAVVNELKVEVESSRSLLERLRETVAAAFTRAPEPRTTS
jgi:hypothetical protein